MTSRSWFILLRRLPPVFAGREYPLALANHRLFQLLGFDRLLRPEVRFQAGEVHDALFILQRGASPTTKRERLFLLLTFRRELLLQLDGPEVFLSLLLRFRGSLFVPPSLVLAGHESLFVFLLGRPIRSLSSPRRRPRESLVERCHVFLGVSLCCCDGEPPSFGSLVWVYVPLQG